jgi:aminopeptidase N
MAATENITKAETQERAAAVAVDGYEVDLDLTGTGPTFASTTTVRFTATQPSTWIDLIADSVTSIELNGEAIDPTSAFDGSRIALQELQGDNVLTVRAQCRYMNTGEGLHRFIDPVDNETYLYTQFESADARRMYACFEQPDLKGTFALTVTAPAHWKVVSNAPTPTPASAGDGIATWSFPASLRMSTYITALVAGPYHEVRDEYTGTHGTYPLGVYCRASLAQYLDADDILLITKQGFAFFEERFGIGYPFGKYDQLFVPEFNAGAMDNAGCVTFLEDLIFRSRVTETAYEQRANTILHEMAHMWFGDLVTMRWWDDLWLNESFAEWAAFWAASNCTRFTDTWTNFSNQRKAWAYRQDQLPSTHPIAADMVDLDSVRVNFDGITYAKGASALKQLVTWVGEEKFLDGVRAYFGKHAWQNTELTDLLVELETTSGRDLSQWTREWLQTPGVNLMRSESAVADDGTFTSFTIVQEPPSAPEGIAPTLRSHRMRVGLYDLVEGQLERRDSLELDVVGARTEVPALIGAQQPDFVLLNDEDLTFTKIRVDDRSWNTAIDHFGTLKSSLARALIWGAAWDMTRDAEVSAGDYLALVVSGCGVETDIGAVQMALRQVRAAIDQYAAPEHREEYVQTLASAMLELARDAQSGSDHQLAFARTFAGVASSVEHLEVVAGLLDGTEVWPGLVIDTDLRWSLLQRLVATGTRAEDAVEAELASDDTATGRRQAAVAMASRPSAAAKELAWADILDRTDLPNAILESTIGGFVQPDQRDLLAPYRERYFAELQRVWSERTMETAQSITMGLYPFLLVDDETLRQTDAFLEGDCNAALRRLVSEGRDGVVRAMRARAKDASA